MIEIDYKKTIFKTKQIWFADFPYDVENVDRVIFRDCKNKINMAGFSCNEFTTLVIDLTQDLGSIWKNMSEGNVRKPIRRAERAGVKVKLNQGYEEFYDLYRSVIKGKHLSGITSQDAIKKYGTLFVAELDNKIISGHGYLEDSKNIRSWVIGSKRFATDEKYATMVANAGKFIVWEAIKYAKAKGIKEFDFGGYYTGSEKDEQKEKINIFKKSFGGKLVTHYNYRKDYSKFYNFLSAVKKKLYIK